MKRHKKNNIVVFGGSALGDSIVVTTFLKNLKKHLPFSNLTYITSNLIGLKQLENVPYIDELKIIKGINLRGAINVLRVLMFGNIDYIVFDHSFYSFPTYLKYILCKVTFGSKNFVFDDIKYSKYFDNTYMRSKYNIVKQYGDIVSSIIGKKVTYDDTLEIYINYKKDNYIIKKIIDTTHGSLLFVLHMGGDNEKKVGKYGLIKRHRNIKNWLEIINFIIQKYDGKVIIIGGKEDYNFAENIKRKINSDNINNVSGNLSLEESTELIRNADMFISTDSGPMHIAMGFKKKQIALLGEGTHKIDPYITFPIRKKYVNDITAMEIKNIIERHV